MNNLNHNKNNYILIQASIYEMPIKNFVIDRIYSIGVLQHMPHRRKAVIALSNTLKTKGKISMWVYEKSFRSLLGYKYWIRPIVKTLSLKQKLILSKILVTLFLPLGLLFDYIPILNKYLLRLLPFAFRKPRKKSSLKEILEWSVLDTYDNISPEYDNPISEKNLINWLEDSNIIEIKRLVVPSLALTKKKMKINIKKKIIIFDSWTLGSRHIFRFVPLLVNKGIELCYCHVGSWGDDISRKKEEVINNLKFRDISYYGNNLKKILDHEKPDLVLFLSLDPMIHRAFNLYVKNYRILSVVLYPGLWSVQSYSSLFISPKNFFSHFASVLSRFYKSLIYSIPTYIKSMKANKSSILDWYDFFSEFLFKFIGYIKHVAPKSALVDYAFVFNNFDQQHAMKKFNLPKKNVFVIGIPDFIKFKIKNSQINSYSSESINKNNNYIVYIGSGPRSTLMKFKNPEDYANHIIFTAKYLKKNLNFKLACKLHYSRVKEYEILKKEKNITLINDDNFAYYLKKSRGALVEPSSAVLIPMALGVPVFFACYGKLKGIKFGPALLAYPNKKIINQLSDISYRTIFKKKNKVNDKTISRIIGPQPSSLLPKRITNHLISILDK